VQVQVQVQVIEYMMGQANALAMQEDRDISGLDSAQKVGQLLTRMGIPKLRSHERRGLSA